MGESEPHLPPKAKTGRPRADDRGTLNGILYVLLSGCRWMDMPAAYGSHKTAWRRLKQWEQAGVWKRLWRECLHEAYRLGDVELTEAALDSSTVAAGAMGLATTGSRRPEGRSSTRS